MANVGRVAALALACTFLLGCQQPALRAPEVPHRWAKHGATYNQFLKDRQACIQRARSRQPEGFLDGSAGMSVSNDVVISGVFVTCMARRGYKEDPNGPFVPPGGGLRMQ
jgi:hypothetical protein